MLVFILFVFLFSLVDKLRRFFCLIPVESKVNLWQNDERAHFTSPASRKSTRRQSWQRVRVWSAASPAAMPELPPPLCIDVVQGLPPSKPVSGAIHLANDSILWQLHEDIRQLGKGYFGRVRLARERGTGRINAVKMIYTVRARATLHQKDTRSHSPFPRGTQKHTRR